MSSEVRKFFPEAEKVWHKDYQCNYYRGVIIDGEDHIVERCTVLRAEYEEAVKDAEKKMAISPLYAKQTNRRNTPAVFSCSIASLHYHVSMVKYHHDK